MVATTTKPKKRVVDVHTERDYVLYGKKVNKNVYDLQMLYENTQAKTTKVLPDFFEHIRFMIVKGICKATFTNSVDQSGDLFNHVVEELLRKIVPTKDPDTGELKTKYDKTKANLGSYILSHCYWSVVLWKNKETQCEGLCAYGDFFENYEGVSEEAKSEDLTNMKFICNYDKSNTYALLVEDILGGSTYDRN